jgi:hypothetical protein
VEDGEEEGVWGYGVRGHEKRGGAWAAPLPALELPLNGRPYPSLPSTPQDLAKKCAAQKVHPLRVKKLYVLAALEIEKFKKRTLEVAGPDKAAATLLGGGGGTATMAATAAQVGRQGSWGGEGEEGRCGQAVCACQGASGAIGGDRRGAQPSTRRHRPATLHRPL